VANLWLRHTVHASLGPLRHLVSLRRVHPERLYVELARLAGALCTFTLDGDPRAVPAYDHRHLGPCFAALERQIRARLELAAPTTCLRVPLTPLAGHAAFHTGQVRDPRAFGRSAHWVLALRSTAPGAYLMMEAPSLVKACAGGDWIVKLVAHAMTGLPIEHLPAPPPALSPRPDTVYFTIGHDAVRGADPERKCWDLVGRTGEIGLYVPEALATTHRELLVLVDG
jgi:type VI secretion system protein ImpJ